MGFELLFNGKDLTGWKGLVENPKARAEMSPEELAEKQKRADEREKRHWKVVDGILVFDGHGDNLCTVKDYGDFELLVDWKIEPKGDSELVVDGVVMENYWERDKPIYPTGSIELQNHGNTLYFRNIYIKELGGEAAG